MFVDEQDSCELVCEERGRDDDVELDSCDLLFGLEERAGRLGADGFFERAHKFKRENEVSCELLFE